MPKKPVLKTGCTTRAPFVNVAVPVATSPFPCGVIFVTKDPPGLKVNKPFTCKVPEPEIPGSMIPEMVAAPTVPDPLSVEVASTVTVEPDNEPFTIKELAVTVVGPVNPGLAPLKVKGPPPVTCKAPAPLSTPL